MGFTDTDIRHQRRTIARLLRAAGFAPAKDTAEGFSFGDLDRDYVRLSAKAWRAHARSHKAGEARERELVLAYSAVLAAASIPHLTDLSCPVIRVVESEPLEAMEARQARIAAAISWSQQGDTWEGRLNGWYAQVVRMPSMLHLETWFHISLCRPDGSYPTQPGSAASLSGAKAMVADHLLGHRVDVEERTEAAQTEWVAKGEPRED